MKLPKLIKGTLLRRYKRFIADVLLTDKGIVSAHCPNTGSMLTCSEPGRTVYLSRHNQPGRKYPYTWELIQMPTSLVGINTQLTNKIVAEALTNKKIPKLENYDKYLTEVKTGKGTRIDFKLQNSKEPQEPPLFL